MLLAVLEGHRARSFRSSLGKRILPRILQSLLPIPFRSGKGATSSTQRTKYARGGFNLGYPWHGI